MSADHSNLTKTVVVLGATGHFGKRICRRLLGESGLRLVVTSRTLGPAEALAAQLQSLGTDQDIVAAALNHQSKHFQTELKRLAPFLVIHTAGPFQGQDYGVARACIACGSHYVDLADGRSFVDGFGELNKQAERAGLLLVTGASTLPGLSSAVVGALNSEFQGIRGIEISIAPAHQTPRGRGTIAAVLSYCGKPFQVLTNGRWTTCYGWQDLRMQNYPALGRRLSAACDVPDLTLFPAQISGLETATFHAALEAWWEQLSLWLMAGLTRLKIVREWSRFVPAFDRVSQKLLKLGSSAGGMLITIRGIDHSETASQKTWLLTAHDNHGPEIPCSPALVLARNLLHDRIQKRGAMPCFGLVTLDEFDHEVRNLKISWQVVS